MEKINFINNQAPALNATNLNQLQTNIENEFTDSNDFKNLYSNNYLELLNLTYSNGTFTQTSADTRTDLQWKLQAFNDSTFIKQLNSKTNNSLIRQSMNFTKDSSFNAINFGLNGTSNDTTLMIDVSNLENDKTYTLSWNLLNNVQGSIAWNEVQIEEGTSMTSYKPFVPKNVENELIKKTEIVFSSFGPTAQETYTFDLTKNALYLLIVDVGANSCLVDIVMTKYNTLTKTTINNDEANWINISYSDTGTVTFSTTYSSVRTIVKLT